jgi:hypothetical protein
VISLDTPQGLRQYTRRGHQQDEELAVAPQQIVAERHSKPE